MRYRFFFSSRRRHTRYIGDWSSDVCSSDLKGRDFNRNDVETVVEVLTEAALADQRLEVAVGRRDDAHVHPDRVLAPNALERLLLERPEDFRLRLETHVADLVEEERAAVREIGRAHV